MIRLILIDVDGTLTGTGARIHPDTWPALEEARGRGVHLALCTGRPGLALAAGYAREVSPAGFHIFQNGAVVSSPAGTVGYVSQMPALSYRGLVEAARLEAQALEVYTPSGVFLERRDALTEQHAELLGLEPETADLLALEGPVVRAQWVVPFLRLRVFEAITGRFPDLEMNTAVQLDMPGVAFSSVTRLGASKVSAARWLAEHLGVAFGEVAMVGDGDGDRELVAEAGLGIAMGNATDGVKVAAKRVVADVDAGGLAEAVRVALEV